MDIVKSPLIPEEGGGASMETYLYEYNSCVRVVRECKSIYRAKQYENITKRLSCYGILPRLFKRQGRKLFYEYIPGRNLKVNESSKVFHKLGAICAHVNSVTRPYNKTMNHCFNKQLRQLESGSYNQFTRAELKHKSLCRPNERLDKRRIKPLLSAVDKKTIIRINNYLANKTRATTALDMRDMSPSNFRIHRNKIYIVDIGGISNRLLGMGVAKCFDRWATKTKQRLSFKRGYMSISSNDIFNTDYMNLLRLHDAIQSLHDRAKLGRMYVHQLDTLKDIIKNYAHL